MKKAKRYSQKVWISVLRGGLARSAIAESPAFIIIHTVVLIKIKFKHILSVYNGQAA